MRIAKIMSQLCTGFSLNLIENGTFYVSLVLKRQKRIAPTIVTEEPGKAEYTNDRCKKNRYTIKV